MPDFEHLNETLRSRLPLFQQAFPNVGINSGYRDAATNAAVGGAKGSQHIGGNALDLSLKGMSDADQLKVLQWWRDQGAQGFGYYPNSQSAHVDFGAPRAWGPNYSRTSLGETPQFFQTFAANVSGQPVNTGATPGVYSGGAAVSNPPDPAPAATPAPAPAAAPAGGLGAFGTPSGLTGTINALGSIAKMAQPQQVDNSALYRAAGGAPAPNIPQPGKALNSLLDPDRKRLGVTGLLG